MNGPAIVQEYASTTVLFPGDVSRSRRPAKSSSDRSSHEPISGRKRLDPVTLEVLRNALPAIADEMAVDLQRTSYNMMIYEVRDYCCAAARRRRPLICQNIGGVSHFVADLGRGHQGRRAALRRDGFEPGDVIITNHQARGRAAPEQHLHLHAVSSSRASCWLFAIVRAHWVDVGGMSTGFGAAARSDPWMEGLQLDQIKIYEGGEPDEKVLRMIIATTSAFRNLRWATCARRWRPASWPNDGSRSSSRATAARPFEARSSASSTTPNASAGDRRARFPTAPMRPSRSSTTTAPTRASPCRSTST